MRRLQVIGVRAWSLLAAAVLCLAPAPCPGPAVAQQAEPAQSSIPKRPQDPRALKAYAVFNQHCARCHQTGKTDEPLASGNLANILDIAALARDPLVTRPGLPDASPLYDILVTRHAPLDIYDSADSEPRPEDIEAVRDWISQLPPETQTCPDRKPISPDRRDAWMRDAQKLERDQANDLRFISLIHLYNACAPQNQLAAYGEALNKLVNALSWAPAPLSLTRVDDTGTLYALRLSDIDWTPAQWELLTRYYPSLPPTTVPDDILARAATRTPVVNGDWFAATASEPPLYYALLDIPAKLGDLAKKNGIDIDRSIAASAARRIAVRDSTVTRGNRLAERHAGAHGGMWLVYDFATSHGAQDIFAHPLGPKPTPTIKEPFKPDEIRAAFSLPNGFFAYVVYDANGNRVDRVLPGIEKPYAGVESNTIEPVTKPGSNCMACHMGGARVRKDDFRPYVLQRLAEAKAAAQERTAQAASAPAPGDPAAPPLPPPAAMLSDEIRNLALSTYSPDGETGLLITGDNERYRRALEAVRIDPALRIDGKEIVSALADVYRGGSDLKAAAALTGVPPKAFLKTLSAAKGAAAALARRLQQGVLPRADLNRLFALLDGSARPETPKGSGGFFGDIKSEIGLSVWIDKLLPAKDDLVTIKAEADTPCYLTIIGIDGAGKGTVLYPNDFERDNLLHANETIAVPGPDSPYQLRFKANGTEMLIGRCSTSPVPPTGIEHDFIRQRFTVLGNWENFIADTLATDAEMRRFPEKAEQARNARAAAARRSGNREPDPDLRPNTAPGQALRDGRAVVIIE